MPMPPLSKLNCSRGAPMGRRSYHEDLDPETFNGRVHLAYVPFVDGAYDRGGAYWGCPANLYRAYFYDRQNGGSIDWFCRASSREDAKRQFLEEFPCARFYR